VQSHAHLDAAFAGGKVLAGDGLEPAGGSAAEFAVILKNEVARWGEVVRQAKVKVD